MSKNDLIFSTLVYQQSMPCNDISCISFMAKLVNLSLQGLFSKCHSYFNVNDEALVHKGYSPSSPKVASLLVFFITDKIIRQIFWCSVSAFKVSHDCSNSWGELKLFFVKLKGSQNSQAYSAMEQPKCLNIRHSFILVYKITNAELCS